MSGALFWEDNEEFDEDPYETNEEYDENNQYSNQDDGPEAPSKNALAMRLAEKVAIEKKNRNQLINEVDAVKDKFSAIAAVMKKQELDGDMAAATEYLTELVQLNFYNLLMTL